MKISQAQQASIMKQCEQLIRQKAPRDTGNLALNAVRVVNLGNGVWEIYVDEKIAPYMKYTEENWGKFRPPLAGKKNPNEGWFDKVSAEIAQCFADQLKVRVEKQ